jgi:cytochrome b6-f complex iron-sulfur subunit
MQCTHADNEVQASQNGFYCNSHGSKFDANGKVLKGPASLNLKQYQTSVSNNNLIITI